MNTIYAVIEFNDDRKKQNFEMVHVTKDLNHAKLFALNRAKQDIPIPVVGGLSVYKITEKRDYDNEYIQLINPIITRYRIIKVKEITVASYTTGEDVIPKYKIGHQFISYTSNHVYAVVKIYNDDSFVSDDNVSDLICNDYFDDDDDDD